jgi:4-diphosphocytidyl-2C-methyl-D-erythritol kinase
MSGSGSACFGLFHESSIDRAKEKIAKKYPNWMIKKALLNDL